ncbi:MAG: hypothetical protein H7839_11060 [Magnetococcus sp. YQC-5]
MKAGNHKSLTHEQKAQLQTIKNMPDEQIDLSDMPEKLDWSQARRGLFCHTKQSLIHSDTPDITHDRRHPKGDFNAAYTN